MNGTIIDRRTSGGDSTDLAVPGGSELMAAAVVNGGAAMQRTATSYATAIAVQKPRHLARVEATLLQEANMAGESFFYGWSAGKDRIEGPSVDLANAAFRAWGNCAIEMAPVQETHDAWIFTAIFVDLENGVSMPRQFRQSKRWNVFGKLDEYRKEDVRFQIGQSKAIRNVILNALPKWLTTKAMEQARDGVKAKIEAFVEKNGIAKAVEMVLRALAKHGINEDRVLHRMGVAKREALDVDKLVILRGDAAALDEGREFPNELFPPIEADKGGDGKSLADKIRGNPSAPNAPAQPTAESPAPEGDAGTGAGAAGPDMSSIESWQDAISAAAAEQEIDVDQTAKIIQLIKLAGNDLNRKAVRQATYDAFCAGKIDLKTGKIIAN